MEDDLAWVEATLAQATSRGERPGPRRGPASRVERRQARSPDVAAPQRGLLRPVPDAAREMAVVAELVHSATLLHDDVIDDGTERRGSATARTLWGNAVSVLAGDLLLVEALDRTARPRRRCSGALFLDASAARRRGHHTASGARRARRVPRHLRSRAPRQDRVALPVGDEHGGAPRRRRPGRSRSTRHVRRARRHGLSAGRRRARLRQRDH